MTRDLQDARNELEDAAETAERDVSDSLQEVAREFDALARDDAVADHAILDAYLNTLRQARERANDDTEDQIDRAIEAAKRYREHLEQA